jgi:SAM-dependent methyltransferase
MASFRGSVDYFDGTRVEGWALDDDDPSRPVQVEIYVDDMRVATVAADRFREDLHLVSPGDSNRSFSYRFEPPLGTGTRPVLLPRTPRVTVKYAGTDLELWVHPELYGLVNDRFQEAAERICLWSDNRFMPTPDSRMIAHVAGDGTTAETYRAVGMYLLLDLLHYGVILDSAARVVDLGCGCGRLAAQLAPILNGSGSYTGFDTWAEGIAWARANIASVYPSFRFERLGASRLGKDPGYAGESAFDLDLEDGSCTAAVAASLLTHLSFDAALAYLRELARVLRPGGRAYVTVFIYDDEGRQILERRRLGILPAHRMRHNEHGAVFKHPDYFDMYFTEQAVAALSAEAGLEPVLRRAGSWRGSDTGRMRRIGHQDLLILRRPE